MVKKSEISYKYNFNIYLDFLKKYKKLFILALFITLLIEATNIIERYLFKVIIDNGTNFISGKLLQDKFIYILTIIALVFSISLLIRSICRWYNMHLINRLEADLIADLKRKYFNHLLNLSHKFHITHKTGSLISKLLRGGRAVEGMTDLLLFNIFPLLFEFIITIGSLIYFDLNSAIIVFIITIIFVLYSFVIQTLQKEPNVIANKIEDFEKGSISDVFTNIDSIKYFGKEDLIKSRFIAITNNTKRAFLKNWDYARWLNSGQSLILGLGTFLLIYFPLNRFLDHSLSLGTLTFIYSVYFALVGNLFGFVWGIRGYYSAMADFDALFKYGKFKNDIKDDKNAKNLFIKEGDVEFKNVSFNYQKRNLFSNFNLKINKNEKVALVGPSGSGKTSLVKLLYRFYDVEKGEILIDHKNIKKFKQESLRSELSIVPQECVLFDDTIYNNISFSKPKASRKEIMQAMRFAQLDKIVKLFPKKENTIVGERGVKLSGGEKQRVSIARAILANKRILILDEATSSLDSETEHEIQRDLKKLMEKRTSIIIAHRLSTIMIADKIVVIDKGKIVQMGRHDNLIKQEGLYKRLWSLQKGGYIK